MLERLAIGGFRNISAAELELGGGINLIVGDNGAGKTSLLEAVHCLARARSFLPVCLDSLTQRGCEGWWLRGEIGVQDGSHTLGVGRWSKRTRVRLDGEAVARLSEVAWLLPVQVINARTQRLLTDGPDHRRGFLNWAVFHVERGFSMVWRRYERALRQRNAALKAGDEKVAAAWEPEMAAVGEEVDGYRRGLLAQLEPLWRGWLEKWLPAADLCWSYQRGWGQGQGLKERLAEARPRELAIGYSLSGPQRADLRFLASGEEAGKELSRGQQKLVVTALRLSLVELLANEGTGAQPLVLIDDLPSELDRRNQARVLEGASALGAQTLVTAIEREGMATGSVRPERVFHVERGVHHELL